MLKAFWRKSLVGGFQIVTVWIIMAARSDHCFPVAADNLPFSYNWLHMGIFVAIIKQCIQMFHCSKGSELQQEDQYTGHSWEKYLWARGQINRILENQKAQRTKIEKKNKTRTDYPRTVAQLQKV